MRPYSKTMTGIALLLIGISSFTITITTVLGVPGLIAAKTLGTLILIFISGVIIALGIAKVY